MVSELPACLSHLEVFEDWPLSLDGLEWSLKALVESTAAISATQLSTKLSREATIWASTPFNSLPILGLTILLLPIRLQLNHVSVYSWVQQRGEPPIRQRL